MRKRQINTSENEICVFRLMWVMRSWHDTYKDKYWLMDAQDCGQPPQLTGIYAIKKEEKK